MEAHINHTVLRWARNRADLSTDMLAKKIGTAVANVEAWESGEKSPSFNQAQSYAHYTHIPFGYLFLREPPEDKTPIPDLRTVNGVEREGFSIELKDTIQWVLLRQEWYKEYLQSQGYDFNQFVGRFREDAGVQLIVDDIRRSLAVARHPIRGTFEDYFSTLVTSIENIGVLVMRNSIVSNNTSRPLSVEEFRGFAISDKLAPVIFINTADSPEARLFTLLHELAHIWIGSTGVSDGSPGSHRSTEKLCNAVAAEFLVPEKEFLPAWNDRDPWIMNVQALAKRFHVSEWVTARRALTFNLITGDEYGRFIAGKLEEYRKRQKSGQPPYNRLQTGRLSKSLAQAVASEAISGRMLYRDAAKLMGIKPEKILSYSKKELGL